MIREINLGSTESVLEEPCTKGLGRFRFYHPAGTFAITPASNILFRTITVHVVGQLHIVFASYCQIDAE